MDTVTNFIFLGSKITADSDCSHEIKRCLLLGRKAMTNLLGHKSNLDKFKKTEIKIAGRNINDFRYADDTTMLMAESEEKLKSL